MLFFEHVHVVSASPRILAASIVARYCRILALVLHIPTSEAKIAAHQAVYDDASLILQSCARSARHVFVSIDFNGTVGEFASLGIGTCGDAASFWTLVESCLPTSWSAGPFVILLFLIHVSRDGLPLGLLLSVAVLAMT